MIAVASAAVCGSPTMAAAGPPAFGAPIALAGLSTRAVETPAVSVDSSGSVVVAWSGQLVAKGSLASVRAGVGFLQVLATGGHYVAIWWEGVPATGTHAVL